MKKKNVIKWLSVAVFTVLVFALVYSVSGKTMNAEKDLEEMATVTTASTQQNKIESLVLSNVDDLEIGVGKQDTGIYAKVELGEDADLTAEDIVFVSSNPEVAEVVFDRVTRANSVYCVIRGVTPGEAEIYAVTAEGELETPHKKVVVTANN
ncbi:hypothetical protein [Butyrivibrio sp. MC2021]|uniref:hypothetical protein n=1 Tax=Butyrivibrio sp. MC2021 TaxID=1408306 RepID=UPI00047E0456|nr:hypothetical protein [Butyrivibrio sp. MC2021]